MLLTWGGYSFDGANSTLVNIASDAVLNDAGQVVGYTQQWDVEGWIHGDTQAELTAKLNALQTALSRQYQDLLLLDNSGNLTAHQLRNAASINGVRVKRLTFPTSQGAEYATYRTFQVQFEANVYNPSGAGNPSSEFPELLSFRQRIRIKQPGPVFVNVPLIDGPAQRQKLYSMYPGRLDQSGEATGIFGYPPAPLPLAPQFLMEMPDIEEDPPERQGNGFVYYRRTWSYRMEPTVPVRPAVGRWPL